MTAKEIIEKIKASNIISESNTYRYIDKDDFELLVAELDSKDKEIEELKERNKNIVEAILNKITDMNSNQEFIDYNSYSELFDFINLAKEEK
jgi:hypothetical protein